MVDEHGTTGGEAPPVLGRIQPASRAAGDDEILRPGTQLDALVEELGPVGAKRITLDVLERPGWTVRYNCRFGEEHLARWRKEAADGTKPGGVSETRLAAILIASQCEQLIRQGEELLDEGKPLTFRSRAFRQLIGADDAVDGVLKFFGNDFHVASTGNRILARAGYAQLPNVVEDDEEGPTTR